MSATEAQGVSVRVHKVDKSFARASQEILVLRQASLEVAAGEFVAVVGPSGSGKSTLLQLIGGLAPVTAGVIRVGDQRLDALGDEDLARFRRSKVGFVFQSHNLIPTLSVLENAALPLLLASEPSRRALAAAEDLLVELGLSDRLDHAPDELSGGEMQRVSLARAIVTRPPLVLADEPTGSLDSYTAEEVMRLLLRVPKSLGQTVILVTHDARAAAYADRIVTLRDGAIREGRRASTVVS
jgi:putative ABC transport system ATP-binding protein